MDTIMYSILPSEEFFRAMDCCLFGAVICLPLTPLFSFVTFHLKCVLLNIEPTVVRSLLSAGGPFCFVWYLKIVFHQ